MKKNQRNRILQFTTIIVATFLAGSLLHAQFVPTNIEVSVWGVYFFFALSALFIYGAVEITLRLVPSNTGYAFLMGLFIKMGVFLLIYNRVLISDEPASKSVKILMLIPFFVFLAIEALGVMKVMKEAVED